ncbi:hypothetical protein TNCV_4789611 [Trichonephila clavipes]|nr:hypothetical protein TNCV_4789611 [Trichonephila clavipes]
METEIYRGHVVPTTPHHCTPHSTWDLTDWVRIIFRNESRLKLSPVDQQRRIERRLEQRRHINMTFVHPKANN